GLLQSILDVARLSLRDPRLCSMRRKVVRLLSAVPSSCNALIGVGGGKALDVGKNTPSLAGLPYFAVPTSLSNDGFCSPPTSWTLEGKRRSLPILPKRL